MSKLINTLIDYEIKRLKQEIGQCEVLIETAQNQIVEQQTIKQELNIKLDELVLSRYGEEGPEPEDHSQDFVLFPIIDPRKV